ncbi:MAG: adenine methylase [Desulfovibrionales bacterium]|nr:adenine methylase [Desulfovibrionales bacterium]
MQFYTPLRYPGGKGRLAGFMKKIFLYNNLCDSTYIEPYAGGAAVALNLLFEEYAWRIIINDADPLIFSFWYTVLYDTEWLLRKLIDTKVNINEWNKQRAIHAHYQEHSMSEVGFATLFMNRTNRSGIIKAGVIGGKEQRGAYPMSARFNKQDLSNRIQRIANYGERIAVTNLDAAELIARVETDNVAGAERIFFYFDPPYYKKGSLLYSNFYTHEDHLAIAEQVQELNVPWIMTYDCTPEIESMYSEQSSVYFTLIYSANEARKKGTEIMFYNRICLPPEFCRGEMLHFQRN